jgi:hypothetical protein
MRPSRIFLTVAGAPPAGADFLPWLYNANQLCEGKMLKNTAGQSITSLILTASGTAVTAGTTTVRVTGDGGTQSGSGTATHEGNGQWSYAPSQAETNFNQIGFLFLNTGGVPVERTVFTDPINISSLNTQVSSLFTSVGSLHTRVSSVAVEVSSNAVGIGLVPVDASSTWTAIGSLSTRVSSVGIEVDSIQSYVAAILDDTGTSGVVIADKTGFSLAADQSGVTVGTINAIAGTINTLDALDTAQDTQHTTTRTAISSLDVRVSSAAAEVGSNAVAIGLIPTDASSTWTALSSLDTRVSSAAAEVSSNATSISSLHTRVSSIQASSAPTAAQVADAVWDEAIADHLGAGSTGEALNAAGASGDPWTTTLPGAYTGTQAGALLGSTMANSLYSRVSSMQTAIGAIPTDATSTWTAIASLDTRVSSIGVEVDSIQSYAAAILDDTGTSGVQVADKTGYSINGTITTLDALDTTQDVQHAATLAAVGSLDTRVTSAAVQIGSNATAISSLAIQVGSVDTRVSSITGVSSATISAAVWNAALSEPTSAPAANATATDKLGWVFAKSRNKMTQTGSLQTLYADNDTTVISSASVSDDGTTLTRGKDQ